MMHKKGFTLVELLVVVAIIAILAAMVIPRVANWLDRARMSRAAGEIHGMDTAITKMLADADKRSFGSFFDLVDPANNNAITTLDPNGFLNQMITANALSVDKIYGVYNGIMYELLRQGKNADFTGIIPGNLNLILKADVKRKLGTTYIDIGMDPWGHKYNFFFGPIRAQYNTFFRCYRNPYDSTLPNYIYDTNAKLYEDRRMRGNPPSEDLLTGGARLGYPASKDLPVYIWSLGADEVNCQPLVAPTDPPSILPTAGAGDDINNWDTQSGWSEFY